MLFIPTCQSFPHQSSFLWKNWISIINVLDGSLRIIFFINLIHTMPNSFIYAAIVIFFFSDSINIFDSFVYYSIFTCIIIVLIIQVPVPWFFCKRSVICNIFMEIIYYSVKVNDHCRFRNCLVGVASFFIIGNNYSNILKPFPVVSFKIIVLSTCSCI